MQQQKKGKLAVGEKPIGLGAPHGRMMFVPFSYPGGIKNRMNDYS